MGKVLLYYKYTPIEYPKQILKWQQKICTDLGLTGRVLIGHEGINGTVGGSTENTDRYKKIMLAHPLFGDVEFKESEGGADCFPRLRVAVRNEIVSIGISPEKLSHRDTGVHLKPSEVHNLLNENPDDLIVLDTRNDYEWKIGRFANAITPPIDNFRQFPDYIDQNLETFKDKQVLMYCTGGVRCERATAYLKLKNVAKQVYQVDGGIHTYVEQYPDGHFRGKNYVFDSRIALPVNDDVLATCHHCTASADDYFNCINASCNAHFISCPACLAQYENSCSSLCQTLLAENKVPKRPTFNKIHVPEKRS